MDELIKNLTSMNWWFGVVIVSLAVNLLSAYVKPSLDRLFSNISEKRKARAVAIHKADEEYLRKLTDNPRLHYMLLAAENRARHQSLLSLLFSITLFAGMGVLAVVSPRPIPATPSLMELLRYLPMLIPGFLALVVGMSAHSKASRYGAYMWELEKRMLNEA